MTYIDVALSVLTQNSVRWTVLRSFVVQPMASRGRVTAYLPEEIQKALEEWAEEDSRSVSSLATYLLTKSVRERQQLKKDKSESDRP